MKFELALAALASLTSASKLNSRAAELTDDYWACFSDWIWEECSGLYYQVDNCDLEAGGWWYAETADYNDMDDWWVSEEEFASWDWCQPDWTGDW